MTASMPCAAGNSGTPSRRFSGRLRLAFLCAVALAMFAGASAQAATFTVNDVNDAGLTNPSGTTCSSTDSGKCTLRAAVEAANNATGSNTITLPLGHYTLTLGELAVTSTLTINGAAASTTIVDAGGSPTKITSRVFNISTSGSLMMSNTTVENGHPADNTSGGGILASGPLTLTNVVVTRNTVSDPTSTAFGAETVGGGIEQGCSTFVSCTTITAPISLTGVTLSNNQVIAPVKNYDAGGGLYEAGGSAVTITNSIISGNSAPIGGGIVEDGGDSTGVGSGASVTITGSRLSGNSATSNPCQICADLGTGGAIQSNPLSPGSVTLISDTITGNTAAHGGGGIEDGGGDNYTITGTTIADNTAGTSGSGTHGGGIFASSRTGTWTITNSTFSGNKAFGPGQQIAHYNIHPGTSTSHLALSFTTLDGSGGGANSELENSSSLAGDAGSASVQDTIINGGPGSDCSGTGISSSGHNLLSDATCGFSASGDMVHAATGLSALASNGGPTQTEALLSSSPAIDHGGTSCPATDQRGVSRPDRSGTQCDIGAYEVHAPTVTKLSPNKAPSSGGTVVVITGTNLAGATAVHFGTKRAKIDKILSLMQIRVTAPSGVGTVDVTVTTAGGTSAKNAADRFTYAR